MDKDILSKILADTRSTLKSSDIVNAQKFLTRKGYEILSLLGCGSHGAVLLAQDTQNNSRVAIKFIIVENEASIKRCKDHYKTMKELDLKSTAKLLNFFSDSDDNWVFFVMEFASKGNLSTFIKTSKELSEFEISRLFWHIVKSYVELRENDLIHGDLKPENILLSANNTPFLSDNGLPRELARSRSAVPNQILALAYQAPEQDNETQQEISPQSDYYSLGMVLFNLCGYDFLGEMLGIKAGRFPNIQKRKRQNILKLAFQMMVQSPKERANPKAIILELNKIIKPQLPVERVKSKHGIYEGQLFNNMKHGTGKLFYDDGSRYIGCFTDNIYDGKGMLTYSDGTKYEGMWKKGKQYGRGKCVFSDGSQYEGDWKRGLIHGDGEYFFPNGATYIGQWKKGQKHGYGKETDSDGNCFEGIFNEDNYQG